MHRVRPPAALDQAGIERAIERLRQTVRRRGLKSSSVREAIARAALARQGHFSIDELVRDVRVGGVSEAHAATVYRVVLLLVEAGLLQVTLVTGGEGARYERAFEREPRRMDAATRTSTCVALLRGLNVGTRKRLAMRDLVATFEAAGARAVATYIQSGNVLFRSSPGEAARVAARVRAALSDRLGFDVPVVIRTCAQLRAVARANPYLGDGADPAALHVLFLSGRPAAARVSALDPARSPRDRFAVAGREVYLHCPDGIGRSKLTGDYFEGRLATTATARNWRTVTTLVEMAGA